MDAKPYPFTPEQEAWLRDLETTEEPQTTGFLHTTAGYCCLGRACVALGIPEVKPGCFGRNEVSDVAPEEVMGLLRLRDASGGLVHYIYAGGSTHHALTAINDDAGWSFKQIAAYIRANPVNVFLPLEEEV